MSLGESDFMRLKLSTRTIHIILKIQKSIAADDIIEEEYLEHDEEAANITEEIADPDTGPDDGNDSTQKSNDETNPFTGIIMEQEIDINIVLARTSEGRDLMEILQENKKPNDKTIKRITHFLCEFLKSNYGVRASTFYKDLVAKSLVKSYPILASTVSDVPHALWFYLNGRGDGKHAGKIHYHMEYLAKQADTRVFRRKPTKVNADRDDLPSTEPPEIDLYSMVEELKFVVPVPENRKKIDELWAATFNYRSQYRANQDFQSFLEEFPVSTAFEGELVQYDFERIFNKTVDFEGQWHTWQEKLLKTYKHLFREITSDFLRALAIVRSKNPTRGSKRVHDEDAVKDNPLKGLITWIKLDDPLPTDQKIPVLVIRGNTMSEGEQRFVSWNGINMPVGGDIVRAFSTFCQCFDVFRTACAPSDKQFIMFFRAIVFSVDKISTTGEKFVRSLQE
ncbi:uncharacterized protein LOC115254508 [Aedes albopictus]|uniref:DUF4806 domain-containing protein n=2 Tax=Aedes albopictus TaxID=7160 RepID=A0ABM1ZUN8_AEDAL